MGNELGRVWVAATLGVLLAACTSVPTELHVDPAVGVPASDIGRGLVVAVNVVDRRSGETAGRWHNRKGRRTEVAIDGDVVAVIRQRVAAALRSQGFVPTGAGLGADRSLTVEVQRLEYLAAQRVLASEVSVNVTVQGTVEIPDSSYRVRYDAQRRRQGVFDAGSAESLELVNGALSDALQQLLQDPQLLATLTR
jgi:YD repeat-containing protein